MKKCTQPLNVCQGIPLPRFPCLSEKDCQGKDVCVNGACIALSLGPIDKIFGTPDCTSRNLGNKGIVKFRIFAANESGNPRTIPPTLLTQGPTKLSPASLLFRKIRLLDEQGAEVKGVKVSLKVAGGALTAHPNVHDTTLLVKKKNKRVPRAVYALLDMSEASADEDPSLSRTAAPAGWILHAFNNVKALGELDIFAGLLMRGGVVSSADQLFKSFGAELQYIGSDGRRRGFVLTSGDGKERISQTLTNISNTKANGLLPLFSAVEAAVQDTRSVAIEKGALVFNPALIGIVTTRDHALVDKNQTNALAKARAASKGSGPKDAIPVSLVVYPRPEKTSQSDWDAYIDQLCQLTRAGGSGAEGQLFFLPPHPRDSYQASARTAIDGAFHAMRGYTTLSLEYEVTGATAGKRFWVVFQLDGYKGDVNLPTLHFEIRP